MKEDGWYMTNGSDHIHLQTRFLFSQYSGKVRATRQKQSSFLKGETEDLRQTNGDVWAGRGEIRVKIEMASGLGSRVSGFWKAQHMGGKEKEDKEGWRRPPGQQMAVMDNSEERRQL